jgi:hypothetical protein
LGREIIAAGNQEKPSFETAEAGEHPLWQGSTIARSGTLDIGDPQGTFFSQDCASGLKE